MKTMTKVKIVITFIIFLLLVIFILIIKSIKNTIFNDTLRKETENSMQEKKLNMDNDFVKIVRTTAEKKADWTNLPLSKYFRKKYNQKYGILGKEDNYTYLSSDTYDSNKDKKLVVLNVDHNLKQEQYHIYYTVNENNELDDVEIVDKKLLYDENGKEIIYKRSMTKKYYINNLIGVAYPSRLEYDIFEYNNVTKNYLKKWANGFVVGAPIFSILEINELCDYNKQLVYLKCEYPLYDENDDIIGMDENLDKYYKVHYFTDENLWLDDVEVEELSKDEIDTLLANAKGKVSDS